MDKNTKNKAWSHNETKTFIQLCQEEKIPTMLDGKKFRTNDAFKKVQELLSGFNYDRTVPQLIDKYRRLKTAYQNTKSHNNKSGQDRREFEFFNDMEKLLGGRPVTAFPDMYGVDTSEILNQNEESNPILNEEYEDIQYLFDTNEDDNIAGPSGENTQISEENNSQVPRKKKRTAGRVSYSNALNDFAETWAEKQKEINLDFISKMKEIEQETAAREQAETQRSEEFMLQLMQTFMAGIR